jgi:hypothetical protein
MAYVRPLPYPADKWRSTFTAHTRRSPRSAEPGVDYYCPLGTTLVSIGDGVVSAVGGGVVPATGRYVKVNLDDGRSFRYLHLGPRHSLKARGQRVAKGEPLAISGASGYGSEFFGAPSLAQIPSNTGGPHTHATLWPTYDMRFGYNAAGVPYTLDLELYVGGSAAGDGTEPFDPANPSRLETDMYSIHAPKAGYGWLIGGARPHAYRSAAEAAEGRNLVGPANVREGSDAQFDHWIALAGLTAAPEPPSIADATWWQTTVDRGLDANGQPVKVPALQELADTKTIVTALAARDLSSAGDVDEAAIAAALAPLLVGQMGKLDDETIAKLARAAADEEDRRDREGRG